MAVEPDVFRPIVGIDLGTTNSLLAIMREGHPEVVPIDGHPLVPSVVHRAVDGTLLVGGDAKAALVAMPERSIASIKRLMGTDKTVRMAGDRFTPVEISAMILKRLKEAVDELYGEGPKEAIITVPAYFDERQRRDTQDAGRMAGFVVERIINEPTAAALAFGMDHLRAKDKLVVYDLGGGTFDVSIVQLEDGILEVVASNGHRALGGDDFDGLIVDAWCEHLKTIQGLDARKNPRALAVLRREAEQAKIALSDQESVTVDIPIVALAPDGAPISFTTTLTREALDAMIEPLLAKTITLTRETLEAAHLRPDEITEVLLVGGSTRIPRVRALVEELFHRVPRTDVHPDQAVALGAAVQAGIKSGVLGREGLIVTDVAPFTMGIAVARTNPFGGYVPGAYAPIIRKNTTVPTTRTETFYTVVDDQPAIDVEVYQGESEWVKGNLHLGSVTITGLAPKPAGEEHIAVTFRYTLNGTLDVIARAPSTGASVQMRVNDALDRTSEEALKASRERIDRAQMGFDFEGPEDVLEGEIEGVLKDDLVKEAHQLERRLKRRRRSRTHQERVDGMLKALADALAADDLVRLEAVMDDAYDWFLGEEAPVDE